MKFYALIFFMLYWFSLPLVADNKWFPVTVDSAIDPYAIDGPSRQVEYVALPQAAEKWRLCVSFPHLKDDYWLAVNYGVVSEAKRLGVSLDLYEAGGYTRMDHQISQIRACVKNGAQAVIIASIDSHGLNPLVEELQQANLPVIDLVNGMTSRASDARSLVSFYQMGFKTGQFVKALQKERSTPLHVAWFPGPQGAAWVETGNRGFNEAIKGSDIKVLGAWYGDVGRKVQRSLVKEVLNQYPKVDLIVGTSATVLSSIPLLRRHPEGARPQLVSYYMSRGVYNAIVREQVLAAPTDQAVLQGRIAVDQAIRLLQGEVVLRHAAPIIMTIDHNNAGQINIDTILAPDSYRAELTVQ